MSNREGIKIMTKSRVLAFTFAISLMLPMAAKAADITVFDKNTGTCAVGSCEDNETEPGTIQSQVWDLEAFYQTGNSLSMVGGFDFKNGVAHGGNTYLSGDIFFDINANAQYGDSTPL